MHYLFDFLEAYNFTSEGKEEIEDEKKTLINASVLGLIFEKINGYKDGSYFTPGFITMYMSKESIRRAVIQKFNESYNWVCDSFDDLHNHLADKRKTVDIINANTVINSLKICDPAVGSGHFLVSCLNEIISIKSELGMLADENGRVLKGYEAHVENDELIISYDEGEEIFEYYTPLKSNSKSETQRVQETLFREKQTIIENCLFGVDINPNSVSIARLRLWIELLKNAYYTVESNYTELETLPNIDINIKEGNSLVSRFELSNDIFTGADRTAFEVYKLNVNQYKNEHDRAKRKQLKVSIDKTKERIKGIAVNPVKELDIKISDLTEKLHNLNKADMFEEQKSKAESEKIDKKKNDLSVKLDKLISERRNKSEEYNLLYTNAFEWRFEFPEVLNEDGKFLGFDIVIGNPPYGSDYLTEFKDFFDTHYIVSQYKVDPFAYFIELGHLIIKKDGFSCLIIPNTWFNTKTFSNLRNFILSKLSLLKILNLGKDVFDEANIDTAIILLSNSQLSNHSEIINLVDSSSKDLVAENKLLKYNIEQSNWLNNKDFVFDVNINPLEKLLFNKILSTSKPLKNFVLISQGLIPYGTKVESFENKYLSDRKVDDNWKPILDRGACVSKYSVNWFGQFVKFGPWLYTANKQIFYENPKILIQRHRNPSLKVRIVAAFDEQNFYYKDNICGMISNSSIDLKYLLGLINSKLMNFYYIKNHTEVSLNPTYLNELPIKIQRNKLIQIIKLVDSIINSKKNNPQSDTSKLENEIDQLVYKLYGLTEEEIKIVEGSFK